MTTSGTPIAPDTYEALVAAHALAAGLYAAALHDLASRKPRHERRERYETAARDLHYFTVRMAVRAPAGTTIATPDGPMTKAIYVGNWYGADCYTLTEDGGAAGTVWHDQAKDGPFDADVVRYERYTAAGRISHGYVDKVSRKIVQTG